MAYVPISTEHALFECEAIGGLRKVLWSKFEDNSPINMVLGMNAMSKRERCKFILNGFNCKYVQEWKFVYNTLLQFVYEVYMQYTKRYEQENT